MSSSMGKKSLKNSLMFRSSSLLVVAGLALMANSQDVKAQDDAVVTESIVEEVVVFEEALPVVEEVVEEETAVIEEDQAVLDEVVEGDVISEAVESAIVEEVLVEESVAEVDLGDEALDISQSEDTIGDDAMPEIEAPEDTVLDEDGGVPVDPAEPDSEYDYYSYIWGYFDNYPVHNSQTGQNIAEERDFELDRMLDEIGIGADNRNEYYQIMENIENERDHYYAFINELNYQVDELYYNLDYSDENEILAIEAQVSVLQDSINNHYDLINNLNNDNYSYYDIQYRFDDYNRLINLLIEDNFLEDGTYEEESNHYYDLVHSNDANRYYYYNIKEIHQITKSDLINQYSYNSYYLTQEEIDELLKQIGINEIDLYDIENNIGYLDYKSDYYSELNRFLPEIYVGEIPDEEEEEENEGTNYTLNNSFIKKIEYDKSEVLVGEPVTMTIYLEGVPESGKLYLYDYYSSVVMYNDMLELDVTSGDSVHTLVIYENPAYDYGSKKVDYSSFFTLKADSNNTYFYRDYDKGSDNNFPNREEGMLFVQPKNIEVNGLKDLGIENISFSVNSNGTNNYYLWGADEIIVKPGDMITVFFEFDSEKFNSLDELNIYQQLFSIDIGQFEYNSSGFLISNHAGVTYEGNRKGFIYIVGGDNEGEYIFNTLNLKDPISNRELRFQYNLGGFMAEMPKIIVDNNQYDDRKPIIKDVKVNVILGDSSKTPVLIDDPNGIYEVSPGDIIQFILDVENDWALDGVGLTYWGDVIFNSYRWGANSVISKRSDNGLVPFNSIISLEITDEMIGNYEAYITAWNKVVEYVYNEDYDSYDAVNNVASSGFWHSFKVVNPESEVVEPNQPEEQNPTNPDDDGVVVIPDEVKVINELLQIPQLPDMRIPSAGLKVGEELIMVRGETGLMLITDRITYEDGVEVSRELIRHEVLKEATATIIQFGVALEDDEDPSEEDEDEVVVPGDNGDDDSEVIDDTPDEEENGDPEETEDEETPDVNEDDNSDEASEGEDSSNNSDPSEDDKDEETETDNNNVGGSPIVKPNNPSNGGTPTPNAPDVTEGSEVDEDDDSETSGKSDSDANDYLDFDSLLPEDVSMNYSGVMLPQTGENNSNLWFAGSAAAVLLGLGLIKGRKEETE